VNGRDGYCTAYYNNQNDGYELANRLSRLDSQRSGDNGTDRGSDDGSDETTRHDSYFTTNKYGNESTDNGGNDNTNYYCDDDTDKGAVNNTKCITIYSNHNSGYCSNNG